MFLFLCQPNQVKNKSFFFYKNCTEFNRVLFRWSNNVKHVCYCICLASHVFLPLYLFRYMYVFMHNTSLLYIPVYLQMLKILHVISIISCSFNTFFIAFGTDVLLSLVLRTSNTFHPLCDTCKIFFDLFLCYSILSIFFIILLFFAYSSYIHNGNCHQFLVYLELVQEYYVHVFHKFPCCGDKVINESKTLDNG